MNILIADDDRNFGFVMKTELETDAHRVDLVHDGVEAVMQFMSNLYGAVLLDVSMPHLDGMNALKIMKKINPGIFAVLFSGKGDILDFNGREASGGNGAVFFQKPFEINLIRDLIHGVEIKIRK